MIVLFGDTWARYSCCHIVNHDNVLQTTADLNGNFNDDQSDSGYQHWALPGVFVKFETDSWFNQHFTSPVINFGESANTNQQIVGNIFQRMNGISNFSAPVDIVVFQTDPIRNFAPRSNYTDPNIVWPRFLAWAEREEFDWQTQDLESLQLKLFEKFYLALISFEFYSRDILKLPVKIHLIGGSGKVHSCCPEYYSVILPSVTEFFGYTNDITFDNHLALNHFVDFWINNSSSKLQKEKLAYQWQHYSEELLRKSEFWTANAEHFAGRHLTRTAHQKLAQHIETYLSNYHLGTNNQ